MLRLFRKISFGVRRYGTGYLLRAPANELRNPRLRITRWLRRALVAGHDLAHRGVARSANSPDHLVFVYDLGSAPVTFDFAGFLACAELERRRRNLSGLIVVFVTGHHGGVRQELPEYEAIIDVAQRQWRVRNILLPMLALLPSVRGHAVCSAMEAESFIAAAGDRLYPSDYRGFLPRLPTKRIVMDQARAGAPVLPLFVAPEQARRFAREFLARTCSDRRPIVVTLRASRYATERNSHMPSWVAFARRVDRTMYAPVFVLDTDVAIAGRPAGLEGEVFCDAASWSIEIRLALYEAAWLNLAVMHGPMELCWFSHICRYLLFLKPTPGSNQVEMMLENGLRIGEDICFGLPTQRIIWETDSLEALERGFKSMIADLADRPALATTDLARVA